MLTTLRLAIHNDLNFMQQCATTAYEKFVARIGKKPAPMVADFAAAIAENQAQIIQNGGEPVGYVISYAINDVLLVENIALLPQCQGKGLSRDVFDQLEMQAINGGRSAIELYTNEKMTENLGLYPKLGFVEIDRRHEDGFDRVYFLKAVG